MHKIGIAYTMYFNSKHERTGNLLMRPFRSKRVSNENYFSYIPQYIHLNAAELYEPGWKNGNVSNVKKLEKSLTDYPYSSFRDYAGQERPEGALLDPSAVALFDNEHRSPTNVISEAAEYYRQIQ